MTYVRRSLYIGIGGTGIKAIAHTKKMFEETFGDGNIPPVIAFLAIDSDWCELHPRFGEIFSADEIVPLQTENAYLAFEKGRMQGVFDWMFPENSGGILHSFKCGTGQLRTNGRLVTELNIELLRYKIREAIESVLSINSLISEYVDVYIAMSLAGGMGAGAFINVAQLVREMYGNQVIINGFGVLYGVFRRMNPSGYSTPRVRLNTYSSILDLDYLQTASPNKPISFNVAGQTKTITSPLYDNFYLIDNKTENCETVDNINVLCQALGAGMFLLGYLDYTSLDSCGGWKGGRFNFTDKLGWAQRFGVCHVVYKGEQLAEIYALKARLELLRQYCDSTDATDEFWREELKRLKDASCEDLLEAIFSCKRLFETDRLRLCAEDTFEATRSKVWKYVLSHPFLNESEKKESIGHHLYTQIKDRIITTLREVGGIISVESYIWNLLYLLDQSRERMENEYSMFSRVVERTKTTLNGILADYGNYLSKWIKSESTIRGFLYDIEQVAGELLKAKIECRRRLLAIYVLDYTVFHIKGLDSQVKGMLDSMFSLRDVYIYKISLIKSQSEELSRCFEYDLSSSERLDLILEEGEVVLTEFTATLSKPIVEMTKEELDAALDAYTLNLPRCEEYRTRLIEDVIQNLSDSDYEALKKEVARKVSPLLKLNDRGLRDPLTNRSPSDKIVREYCAVIYKEDLYKKSRMEMDHSFFSGGFSLLFRPSEVPYLKQRMIFFRSDFAVIPYCVDALDKSVQEEYEYCISSLKDMPLQNPHFDRQIFEDIRKSGFALKPECKNDEHDE